MTVTKLKDACYGSLYVLYGKITFVSTDTYVNGTGFTLSLAGIAKATRTPLVINIVDTTGYSYQYTLGSNANNGVVKIYQSAGALGPALEIPSAAVPAGVYNDTGIVFVAEFNGTL